MMVSFYPVHKVPSEPRWLEPRKLDIKCAPDPSSPDTATLAVTYMGCDITDSYEAFVLHILSSLLVDGASAPFYKSLLEPGLGSGFAPVTGGSSFTCEWECHVTYVLPKASVLESKNVKIEKRRNFVYFVQKSHIVTLRPELLCVNSCIFLFLQATETIPKTRSFRSGCKG